MRDMMEERKRDLDLFREHTQSPTDMHAHRSHEDDQEGEYMEDNDDARSINTIVPHELERVEEEDEEQLVAEEEEEERRQRQEFTRPRTPEPTSMGMVEDDEDHDPRRSAELSSSLHMEDSLVLVPSANPTVPDDLMERMATLTSQLESALQLSRAMEVSHTTAQSTISMLESKVAALETLVQATQTHVQAQADSQQQLAATVEAKLADASSSGPSYEEKLRERESLTEMLNEWKKSVEGQWSGVREEWNAERDRLKRAKDEFEIRVRTVEEGFGKTTSKVDSGLAILAAFQAEHQSLPKPNGSAKMNGSGGLVTPPSPRSLSSVSSRPRQRKRRASSARGRSRSLSPAAEANGHDNSTTSSLSTDLDGLSSSSSRARRRSPWVTDDSSASDGEPNLNDLRKSTDPIELQKGTANGFQYLTPEPSLLDQPVSDKTKEAHASLLAEQRPKDLPMRDLRHLNGVSVMGVLILSVAAAAVIWRVKPEGP